MACLEARELQLLGACRGEGLDLWWQLAAVLGAQGRRRLLQVVGEQLGLQRLGQLVGLGVACQGLAVGAVALGMARPLQLSPAKRWPS